MSGYSNISIPKGLRNEIERILQLLEDEGINLGYKTVAEFVKDSIRRRVEYIRHLYFHVEKHQGRVGDKSQFPDALFPDPLKFVLEIMMKLEEHQGKNLETDVIVRKATYQGMPEYWCEKVIEQLLDNGMIHSPKKGTLTRT